MIHTLAIERSTPGSEDDYGQPSQTYAVLATVQGLVQPKSYREVALTSQGGAVVSDHTIYLRPTDLQEADRIRFEPDDGRRFEVYGVRDAAGLGHHLEVDARMVQ
jgi:head-tail adaptor